ncbi:MAG: OmpA family protein [Bacteroidales bacterium]|nr:OmpA family protein [Bacteroidales bacterium]
MKIHPIILFIITLAVISSSCVPMRQFQELKLKSDKCISERDSLKSINEDYTVKNTEMSSEIEELKKQIANLTEDIAIRKDSIEYLYNKFSQCKTDKEDLLKRQNQLLKGSNKEMKLLLADLQETKNDLQIREDKLYELENNLEREKNSLEILKKELDEKTKELNAKTAELEERNKKLIELENILYTKDSIVLALKNNVSAALLGFENNGLSVNIRNGKVYVSLEEKLLFKFGSSEVDPNGVKALKQLGKVLEQNTNINILIEGHTDDVGNTNYNWDLSVKRATSIVKILLQNSKIDPKRLTAAGRGQFIPIDPANTDAARQKNRRTEIILTPKLDELFKILENN